MVRRPRSLSESGSSATTAATVTTTADQSLGRGLALPVNPARGPHGSSFLVNATVLNALSRLNNVTGVDDYHWVQVNPLCNTGPLTSEVLRGYYTVADYHWQGGQRARLPEHDVHGPDLGLEVPRVPSQQRRLHGTSRATGRGTDIHHGDCDQVSRRCSGVLNVYSDGLTSPEPFPAGVYTVVAADN